MAWTRKENSDERVLVDDGSSRSQRWLGVTVRYVTVRFQAHGLVVAHSRAWTYSPLLMGGDGVGMARLFRAGLLRGSPYPTKVTPAMRLLSKDPYVVLARASTALASPPTRTVNECATRGVGSRTSMGTRVPSLHHRLWE